MAEGHKSAPLVAQGGDHLVADRRGGRVVGIWALLVHVLVSLVRMRCSKKERGNRRLHIPEDWVRVEMDQEDSRGSGRT